MVQTEERTALRVSDPLDTPVDIELTCQACSRHRPKKSSAIGNFAEMGWQEMLLGPTRKSLPPRLDTH